MFKYVETSANIFLFGAIDYLPPINCMMILNLVNCTTICDFNIVQRIRARCTIMVLL